MNVIGSDRKSYPVILIPLIPLYAVKDIPIYLVILQAKTGFLFLLFCSFPATISNLLIPVYMEQIYSAIYGFNIGRKWAEKMGKADFYSLRSFRYIWNISFLHIRKRLEVCGTVGNDGRNYSTIFHRTLIPQYLVTIIPLYMGVNGCVCRSREKKGKGFLFPPYMVYKIPLYLVLIFSNVIISTLLSPFPPFPVIPPDSIYSGWLLFHIFRNSFFLKGKRGGRSWGKRGNVILCFFV